MRCIRRPVNNLRVRRRDPTTHEDFEWHRGAPSLSAYDAGDRRHRAIINKIREGYYDFAICWWGDLGKIVEIGEEKGGNYMLVKDLTGEVRKNMEEIDWMDHLMICTGAPHLTAEMFIAIYEEHTKV